MKINSALPENHPEHLKVDEKKRLTSTSPCATGSQEKPRNR